MHAWLPSLWTGMWLRVTLLWYKSCILFCYYTNEILISITTWPPSTLLLLKGLHDNQARNCKMLYYKHLCGHWYCHNGKVSAQPHTIVKQICFPNGNVLFLSLFPLFKNWMHNVGWGCAEILPGEGASLEGFQSQIMWCHEIRWNLMPDELFHMPIVPKQQNTLICYSLLLNTWNAYSAGKNNLIGWRIHVVTCRDVNQVSWKLPMRLLFEWNAYCTLNNVSGS